MSPELDELYREIARLRRRLDALRLPESRGWDLIEEQELSASAASVTFSSIPGDYRMLVLVWHARTDAAAEGDDMLWRANGDSGANYDRIYLQWTSAGTATGATRATTAAYAGVCEAAGSRANSFGPGIHYWVAYANTSHEKFGMSPCSLKMGDVSADNDLLMATRGSRWRNTAAITSLTILPGTGPNFVSGCVFTLYGIL